MLRRSFLVSAAAAAAASAFAIPFVPAHAGPALKVLKVGVTAGPHEEVLRAALPIARKNGLDIRPVVFQDYVSPNEALAAGEIDANIIQTMSYLRLMNRQRRYGFEAVGKSITLPLAFYSKKHRTFADLPAGARVGIPNDPSTEGRALYALHEAGFIKLKPSAGREGTPLDVIENPKKLRFVELDPAQTARSLDDLDAAAVNGNYAHVSGLSKERKGILSEKPADIYINHIVVRGRDKDAPWVKTLVRSYQDPAVRAYILREYKGSVVPNF